MGSQPASENSEQPEHPLMTIAELIIFGFRFALALLYVIMTLASLSYLFHAGWETGVFTIHLWTGGDPNDNLVGVLVLLDDMMVTSLLFLIIGGSFLVYVSGHLNDRVFKSESHRPPAFTHLSPATLKTKMSGALVGVSAVLMIRLLVEALGVDKVHMDLFIKKVCIVSGIHIVLVISLVVFAYMTMNEDRKANHSNA